MYLHERKNPQLFAAPLLVKKKRGKNERVLCIIIASFSLVGSQNNLQSFFFRQKNYQEKNVENGKFIFIYIYYQKHIIFLFFFNIMFS